MSRHRPYSDHRRLLQHVAGCGGAQWAHRHITANDKFAAFDPEMVSPFLVKGNPNDSRVWENTDPLWLVGTIGSVVCSFGDHRNVTPHWGRNIRNHTMSSQEFGLDSKDFLERLGLGMMHACHHA